MDDQTTCFLDWSYFCHGKSTGELTESLLITTMELQEELKQKDDQLIQLKQLLNNAINERNEAQNKYQSLLIWNHNHRHRQTATPPPHSAVSSIEDEPLTFSSSDCEESIVSSPVTETPLPVMPSEQDLVKALPEKGKFLEAVINAGPLLQNLLLAGPLPHWRHPPPPLDSYRIPPPPVVLPTPPPIHHLLACFNKKRGFSEGSDSSTETKYQRIAGN